MLTIVPPPKEAVHYSHTSQSYKMMWSQAPNKYWVGVALYSGRWSSDHLCVIYLEATTRFQLVRDAPPAICASPGQVKRRRNTTLRHIKSINHSQAMPPIHSRKLMLSVRNVPSSRTNRLHRQTLGIKHDRTSYLQCRF